MNLIPKPIISTQPLQKPEIPGTVWFRNIIWWQPCVCLWKPVICLHWDGSILQIPSAVPVRMDDSLYQIWIRLYTNLSLSLSIPCLTTRNNLWVTVLELTNDYQMISILLILFIACIEACDVSSLLDKFLEYELNQSE